MSPTVKSVSLGGWASALAGGAAGVLAGGGPGVPAGGGASVLGGGPSASGCWPSAATLATSNTNVAKTAR
jgi:hypothetical protein